MDVPLSESLETRLVHGTAVNVMTLVGFTALLYDHIVTFTDEVNFIWKARKGVVSTIFLLNRYCIPVVLALDIYVWEPTDPIAIHKFCKIWTVVQSYLTILSYISIHAIVAWRLYAIFNGKAWVSRLLWIAGFLNFAIAAGIATASLIPTIADLQPYHHACVGKAPDYIWSIWLPSVIFETLLFGLTIKAMLHQGQQHSFTSLSLLLYRDVCSLFSLMVWALAGPDLLGLARYFALAMVNIAGSRLVLNLKAFAASNNHDEDLTWDEPVSARSPQQSHYRSVVLRFADEESLCGLQTGAFDLELYAIERDSQQLGTRLR
ncbi:hypothetical protein BN946_scf185001.g10 [Trametes cinnabarina]|uniref:DUF6533 domain-containing protein n=1 Tax=Pycnoporus cinnabarinus TaxID=5643 RepID=A0A060SJU9_PYCCI|nr:hypothetical protein BN946_scf185001.g10 [Trametes cinnabarina]